MAKFKSNQHLFIPNDAGFSLVEVMAAMALSAIVALGMAMMMQYQSQSARTQNMLMNSSSLVTYLQGFLTINNINYASNNNQTVSGNQMLYTCVNGGGGTCTVPSTPYSFVLNDTLSSTTPPVAGTNQALTGTVSSYSAASNTVYYNVNGSTSTCSPKASDSGCILEAVATFMPSCGGLPSCSKASSIAVTISIQSAAVTAGSTTTMINTPGGIPISGRQTTMVFPIPLGGGTPSTSCFSASNTIYCVKMDNTGSATCGSNSIPPVGSWYVGVNGCGSPGWSTSSNYSYQIACGANNSGNKLTCVRTRSDGWIDCQTYASGSWAACSTTP